MGKVTIITGHYGSGKTEFAVNYAMKMAEKGRKVTVADLDIVNPYFRSREQRENLKKAGISVVSSNFEEAPHLDMPALSARLTSCFTGEDGDSVIDVGGDGNGARVLARFAPYLKNRDYEMWMAVNANRPYTEQADQVLEFLLDIERASGLRMSGFLNTTHMLRETKPEDLIKGDLLLTRLQEKTGLPIRYYAYIKELKQQIEMLELKGEEFPITLHMRPAWL